MLLPAKPSSVNVHYNETDDRLNDIDSNKFSEDKDHDSKQ